MSTNVQQTALSESKATPSEPEDLRPDMSRRRLTTSSVRVPNHSQQYAVEIPPFVQRITHYFIDASPPGQLPSVVDLCRQILQRSLSTIDASGYATALAQAAEELCNSRAQCYGETEMVVIPFVLVGGVDAERPLEDSKENLRRQWEHTACVITTATRRQATEPLSTSMNSWYLFLEGNCAIQLDPLRRCLTNIVALSPPPAWFTTEDASRIDNAYRKEVEFLLRHEYLPQYYPTGTNTAFSVHIADPTSSVFATPSNRTAAPPPSAQASTVLQIVIAAETTSVPNFWAGSWKSVWEIDIGTDSKESSLLQGLLKVQMQYSEDGNMCLIQSMTTTQDIKKTQDPRDFAEQVVHEISEAERRLQRGLEKLFLAFHTEVLRSLRRIVPIGGIQFDWSGSRASISNDIANIGATKRLLNLTTTSKATRKTQGAEDRAVRQEGVSTKICANDSI